MTTTQDQAWSNYEQAKKERKTLPPLTIDGEEFTFPASPPANLVLDIVEMSGADNKLKISNEQAFQLVLRLIGEDNAKRLADKTEWDEFSAILSDLLEQYNIVPKAGKDGASQVPNRATRRASSKRSSTGSARSKRTSAASTA